MPALHTHTHAHTHAHTLPPHAHTHSTTTTTRTHSEGDKGRCCATHGPSGCPVHVLCTLTYYCRKRATGPKSCPTFAPPTSWSSWAREIVVKQKATVGDFLDSASFSTRTEGPRGVHRTEYVQMSKRNRVDGCSRLIKRVLSCCHEGVTTNMVAAQGR